MTASIEDALEKIINEEKEVVLIQAMDKSNQESLRVMCYGAKKKIPKALQDAIGVSKILSPEGRYFVKIYKKKDLELFEFSETGEIVPMKGDLGREKEILRIAEMMRKDGKSEEEIKEVIEAMKGEEKENAL